jgi:hypothetical protein
MDHNKKQTGHQPNDHRSLDGIVRIPQSLRHQSRRDILGDTAVRLHLDDTEISRTKQGDEMRQQRTNQDKAQTVAYIAGYLFVIATFVKLAWWVWAQPW